MTDKQLRNWSRFCILLALLLTALAVVSAIFLTANRVHAESDEVDLGIGVTAPYEFAAHWVDLAQCESGGDHAQQSGDGGLAWGLMSIRIDIHRRRIEAMGYTLDQMLESGPNIDVAVALYREQYFRPWSVCAHRLGLL